MKTSVVRLSDPTLLPARQTLPATSATFDRPIGSDLARPIAADPIEVLPAPAPVEAPAAVASPIKGVIIKLPNKGLIVRTVDQDAQRGDVIAASSLFTVSDREGDRVLMYRLTDASDGLKTGHWVVDGQARAAGETIVITAEQLATTFFVAGDGGSDSLVIQAFDGTGWSLPATVTVTTPNHAPIVNVTNVELPSHTEILAKDMITAIDSDGDALHYTLFDGNSAAGSGYWQLDGAQLAAGTVLSQDQFDRVKFIVGNGTDQVGVQVSDGLVSSQVTNFNITAANAAPVVVGTGATVARGTSILASDVFQGHDANGDHTITQYKLTDNNLADSSGKWVYADGSAVPLGVAITAAQFATVKWLAGTSTTGSSDTVGVQAFDGVTWSNVQNGTMFTPPNHNPVALVTDVEMKAGVAVAADALFDFSDSDQGDHIVKLAVTEFDPSDASGYWTFNGAKLNFNEFGSLYFETSEIGNLKFVPSGQVGYQDHLAVRVYDGLAWSDWAGLKVTAVAAVAGEGLHTL